MFLKFFIQINLCHISFMIYLIAEFFLSVGFLEFIDYLDSYQVKYQSSTHLDVTCLKFDLNYLWTSNYCYLSSPDH